MRRPFERDWERREQDERGARERGEGRYGYGGDEDRERYGQAGAGSDWSNERGDYYGRSYSGGGYSGGGYSGGGGYSQGPGYYGQGRTSGQGGYGQGGYNPGGAGQGGSHGQEGYGRGGYGQGGSSGQSGYGQGRGFTGQVSDRNYSEPSDLGWGAATGGYRPYAGSPWDSRRRGPFAGKGPRGYVRSDERIREDVSDRLSDDDELDASDITVTVSKSEVTLEGSVPDRHSKRRAEDIAESVSGVTEVHNRLRANKGLMQEVGDKLMGRETETGGHAGSGTRNAPAGSSTSTSTSLPNGR